jgi:hypothetical protein
MSKPKILESLVGLVPLTLADLFHPPYHLVYVGKHDSSGRFPRVKVNGKPQTWKTRPGHVRVPYKYGLYEYGEITHADLSLGLWFKEKV